MKQEERTPLGLWWLTKKLLLAMLIAVVMQVVLATWFWPDGGGHIYTLLAQDLRYMSEARGNEELGAQVATGIYNALFEQTGFNAMIRRFADPNAGLNIMDTTWVRRPIVAMWPQIMATEYAIQLFGIRLTILVLSLPIFLLFAFVGGVDGWAARYMRRHNVGRESGFIYGRAKRTLFWSIVLSWGSYLMLPMSLDPRLILLPFACLFGVSCFATAKYFKKYL